MAHRPTCWAALGFVQSIKASETPYGSRGCSSAGSGLQHRSFAWQRQQSSSPHPVPEWPGVTNGPHRCPKRGKCIPVPAPGTAVSQWNREALPGFLESSVVAGRDRWGWQREPGCFSWCLLRRDQPGSCLGCPSCCTGPRDGEARRSLPAG